MCDKQRIWASAADNGGFIAARNSSILTSEVTKTEPMYVESLSHEFRSRSVIVNQWIEKKGTFNYIH